MATNLNIETEQEEDGRWIAEVVEIPGAMAYGSTLQEARVRIQPLALDVLEERLDQGEADPEFVNVSMRRS